MNVRTRNALLVGCCLVVATTMARAQGADPIGDLLTQTTESSSGPQTVSARQTVANPLSTSDRLAFLQALACAKRGDVSGARAAIGGLSDAVARKTATWALVDAN
ncbi:MAG TPA: lytic transglycosylase domain-containing protein, partial [Phenylobacterium sp.]